MFGGKPLVRGEMGEAKIKVPDTTKFLTFVLDLQHAKLLDSEPRKLHQIVEDLRRQVGGLLGSRKSGRKSELVDRWLWHVRLPVF